MAWVQDERQPEFRLIVCSVWDLYVFQPGGSPWLRFAAVWGLRFGVGPWQLFERQTVDSVPMPHIGPYRRFFGPEITRKGLSSPVRPTGHQLLLSSVQPGFVSPPLFSSLSALLPELTWCDD